MPDSQNSNQGFVAEFFGSMPSWIKGIVFLLCAVPVALAISGTLLQVNVGSKLDAYFELQLEKQRQGTEAAADRIIAVFDARIKAIEGNLADAVQEASDRDTVLGHRVTELEAKVQDVVSKVERLDAWVCGPIMRDRDPANDAEWC